MNRAALGALAWILAFGAMLLLPPPSASAVFETKAKQLILVDDVTGTVLAEKNPDQVMYPASMSKMMTLYLAFEYLASGRIVMDDAIMVSERAWRMRGSRMYIEVGSRVTVRDLLRGIVVQSGNDACVALAEGLAGSEEAFVEEMNRKAAVLGLRDSRFHNTTGWPDPNHTTTARDLASLAHHLIADFPQYYGMFAETEFSHNDIRQGNRNPLLYTYEGADGLKTGYTRASGYGLAASAERNGRRLILVMNGLSSVNERAREAERVLNYGFREFGTYTLFKAGEAVDTLPVWLGESDEVPLVTSEDVTLTMPRRARPDMEVKVVADGPVPAPVEEGTPAARLLVSAPDTPTREWPLAAGASVEKLSAFGRIGAAIEHLLWGSAR